MIVLTQNIWGSGPLWPLRRRLLAARIAHHRPDLIGLQEVLANDASGNVTQAHELAERAGGYHVYFGSGRDPSRRCEGVALLSRQTLQDCVTHKLSWDAHDPLERCGARVVLGARLERPEGTVQVFVTHLSLSRRARLRTLQELLAFTGPQPRSDGAEASLLMGDFNAEPGESAMALMEHAGWVDAWMQHHGKRSGGSTWPAFGGFRRLDYIFVRARAASGLHACQLEPAAGSDHRGLVATIEC